MNPMTNRARANAVLHYEAYDHMPLVHFGFWRETVKKWWQEGHISNEDYERYINEEEYQGWWAGSSAENVIASQLGFDYGHECQAGIHERLLPGFEYQVLEERPNGEIVHVNSNGLIEKVKPGVVSIPATIGTMLKDRDSWERLYKEKLQPCAARVNLEIVRQMVEKQDSLTEAPLGLYGGSLYGSIRDMLGVEELAYLQCDDEELYVEVIDTVAEVCYQGIKTVFEAGLRPDFLHFWEDICFKNGPLVNPEVFEEYVGHHYRRITELAKQYGCDIVTLDCDGCIDKLIPTWINNGVNTMFPIEVGTWNANIAPWREQYGRELRGIGGMDKRVFAADKAAVDAEIERLKPLVALGGYIPCPDHRIAPDAKWELVQYYCEQFRKTY